MIEEGEEISGLYRQLRRLPESKKQKSSLIRQARQGAGREEDPTKLAKMLYAANNFLTRKELTREIDERSGRFLKIAEEAEMDAGIAKRYLKAYSMGAA